MGSAVSHGFAIHQHFACVGAAAQHTQQLVQDLLMLEGLLATGTAASCTELH